MFSFYRLVEELERIEEDWKSKAKTGVAIAALGTGLGVMAYGYRNLYKHRKFKELCEKTKCKKYKECIKDCVKSLELQSKTRKK